VNTAVTQERKTTRILKIHNTYRDDPSINAWCTRCESEDVSWIDVADQDADYLKT
jgi:hypothetical protein